MINKVFEIRDRCTYIPVIATKMQSDDRKENYHLRRVGYGYDNESVIVSRLNDGKGSNDAFGWNDARTFAVAHEYIEKHFNNLKTGDVVDVEFILGETKEPKKSEMEECFYE